MIETHRLALDDPLRETLTFLGVALLTILLFVDLPRLRHRPLSGHAGGHQGGRLPMYVPLPVPVDHQRLYVRVIEFWLLPPDSNQEIRTALSHTSPPTIAICPESRRTRERPYDSVIGR